MKINTTGPAKIEFVSRDNETIVLSVQCKLDGFSLEHTKTGALLNSSRGALDGIMIVTLDANEHTFDDLSVTVVPKTPVAEETVAAPVVEEIIPIVPQAEKRVTRKKKVTPASK